MAVRSTLAVLATTVGIAAAQSCPSGYAPYSGAAVANQTINWIACPYEATTESGYTFSEPTLQCGTIQVPKDWTNPNSESLTLPVIRIPANESTAIGKSIFYNPGGPGVSAIDNIIGVGYRFIAGAGGQYDIVTFDPRGVGLTEPYYCPAPTSAQAGINLPLDDPAGLNATYQYYTDQGDICAESEYLELGETVGTAFVARDIDALFQILNEDGKIRYWGFSYGTLLGSTVAAMFPDKIDRMVLDGNINPTDYYHGLNAESVDDVDAALSYFFSTCATAGPDYCALATGEDGPVLEGYYYELLEGLKNGTYETTVQGTSVSYNDAKGVVYSDLKTPSTWPDVAMTIASLYLGTTVAGNSTSLSKRAVNEQSVSKRQSPPFDVSEAGSARMSNALYAITCGDWDDINASLEDFQDYLKLYEDRSKFGGDQLISILLQCSTWDVNAREQYDGLFTNVSTATPLLFVNGPYDPVTPLVSAQNSSSGFEGSVVLETLGAGHCSSAHPSTCIMTKVADYFITGELPDVSTPCQPDALPFSGEINPLVNNTGGPDTVNATSFYSSEAFKRAVRDANIHVEKRNFKVGYPPELVELVRREQRRAIEERSLNVRQASSSASASCTPTGARQTSTASSGSGSGSGNSNAAGHVSVVSAVTLLSVLAGFALMI